MGKKPQLIMVVPGPSIYLCCFNNTGNWIMCLVSYIAKAINFRIPEHLPGLRFLFRQISLAAFDQPTCFSLQITNYEKYGFSQSVHPMTTASDRDLKTFLSK